jgi:hypothetical protein
MAANPADADVGCHLEALRETSKNMDAEAIPNRGRLAPSKDQEH